MGFKGGQNHIGMFSWCIFPGKHMLYVLISVASNEYPHQMFLWRNKKYIDSFWLKGKKKKKKKRLPYLEVYCMPWQYKDGFYFVRLIYLSASALKIDELHGSLRVLTLFTVYIVTPKLPIILVLKFEQVCFNIHQSMFSYKPIQSPFLGKYNKK